MYIKKKILSIHNTKYIYKIIHGKLKKKGNSGVS